MPKNAVQRLQEIESDIKTVISLYEVTSKSQDNNDKPETSKKQNRQQLSKISTPKCVEVTSRFDKFRKVSGKVQTPLFDSHKKTSDVVTRPTQGLDHGESMLGKKWTLNKPGSAPSSSSAINTVGESDSIRLQPSDDASQRGVLAKAKTSDNLSSFEWLDSSIFSAENLVMTPSKTLQTANEILAKNNFDDSDSSEQIERQVRDPEGKGKKRSSGEQIAECSLEVKKIQSFKKSATDIKKRQKENKTTERSRSVSPSDEISVEKVIECNTPVIPKPVVTSRAYNSKDKPLIQFRPRLHFFSRDGLIFDRKASSSGNQKTANSTKKHVGFKNKSPSSEDNHANKNGNKNNESESTFQEKISSINHEQNAMGDDKIEEKKSLTSFQKKVQKKVQFSQADGTAQNNQLATENAKNDDTELWVDEISKFIEKSNDKLQKMKVSKELALDIANHFKEKYDEIQKSKGELLEKLQVAEKNSETFNTKVKVPRESKNIFHQIDTTAVIDDATQTKVEVQPEEFEEEIASLKAKLCEAEKDYNAKLLEKTKMIENIQKTRLVENRDGLKNQEILARKLQQLTNEKCELLSKFDDLRRQLHNSQSTTQTLEDNIHQLEEEVQKQKQHLKIKTETLHETNRELEMIRLNCTDLEDQVKMLRKNIEEFDGIQHSLIRKTTEYEQQIKSNQEKIKELLEENIRLKLELDNEKDGLRIKVKIIEDHQQTIRQLKEKSEDAKTLLKRNQSLERILNTEREEKLELQEALQRLKWRKEELKKKVKTLENDFLLAPQEVVKDLQKTQVVLHELENQVQMKQKEWELQLHSLIREKEQACSVAEFATKKLMETTSEYQKQSEAYKGLQRIVARNLAVKERHLRENNKKYFENTCQ